MGVLLSSETFLEIELHLVDTHSAFKDSDWESAAKLLKTLVGCKGLRLNLILVCLLVK